MRKPTSRDLLNFLYGFAAAALLLILWGFMNTLQADPPKVMRLTSGDLTQAELNKRPVTVRAVWVNWSGKAVSDTLNVLFQHRSNPRQPIALSHHDADVIVTCFPSEVYPDSALEKVLFPNHDGLVQTTVKSGNILFIRAIN